MLLIDKLYSRVTYYEDMDLLYNIHTVTSTNDIELCLNVKRLNGDCKIYHLFFFLSFYRGATETQLVRNPTTGPTNHVETPFGKFY